MLMNIYENADYVSVTRVIHIQNLGSPSLVVGSNNSARVDQNQVEGSGRRFIGGRGYTGEMGEFM